MGASPKTTVKTISKIGETNSLLVRSLVTRVN